MVQVNEMEMKTEKRREEKRNKKTKKKCVRPDCRPCPSASPTSVMQKRNIMEARAIV